MRAEHPDAEMLIHPECGCSTSIMEYVAAGDIDPVGVHMLSTGGMLDFARRRSGGEVVVATEVGMLHGLRRAAPDVNFIAANAEASCQFMKMITLPKLRDALANSSSRWPSHRTSQSARACQSTGWSRSARSRSRRAGRRTTRRDPR